MKLCAIDLLSFCTLQPQQSIKKQETVAYSLSYFGRLDIVCVLGRHRQGRFVQEMEYDLMNLTLKSQSSEHVNTACQTPSINLCTSALFWKRE